MKLDERCKCGAEFHAEFEPADGEEVVGELRMMHADFEDKHESCQPVGPQSDPNSPSMEDVYKWVMEQQLPGKPVVTTGTTTGMGTWMTGQSVTNTTTPIVGPKPRTSYAHIISTLGTGDEYMEQTPAGRVAWWTKYGPNRDVITLHGRSHAQPGSGVLYVEAIPMTDLVTKPVDKTIKGAQERIIRKIIADQEQVKQANLERAKTERKRKWRSA